MIVCYYIFIFKYILNINDELITTYNITVEKLNPIEISNIWYKSIIDDFFNKFTIKSKTIDHKYFTFKNMQSFTIIEQNQDNLKKSILCNIRSDHINSLVLECESYKEKISNLEIQVY